MLLTEKEARSITDRMLSFVKADDAVVSVGSEIYSHLRFAANSFLTSGRRENVSASVTVWKGAGGGGGFKRGSAAANSLDEASLREAVAEAERVASISPPDREYLPSLGPQAFKPTRGFVEATANIPPAARARTIGDIIAEAERSKVIAAGFHQARGAAGAYATKNGNFSFERASNVSLSITTRTPGGDSSGYFLRSHFDVSRLDPMMIARESIRRALEGRDARALEPGVYTVILEPQAVADLLSFGSGFDARSAEEGRSAYAAGPGKTRRGEKIFDERINIYSDPWNPDLPGSQAAQAGIPAEKIHLVRNGVLENLVYSRFWAQKAGQKPTPGPVNIIFESSAPPATVEEMIRSTDRGLLVSRFWYIRSTDPRRAAFTGLTRDGVWLIEGGRVKHAVKNFRFNQSVTEMLAPGNVEMIGRPERVGSGEGGGAGASLMPALKIKKFNFTSQSEAV